MIVVDTSAVVAVLLGEDDGRVEASLVSESCVMSAATRVELGIDRGSCRRCRHPTARRVARSDRHRDRSGGRGAGPASPLTAWRRFGKGRHPAGLNYGDTFAYALARQRSIPLLFVGDDFSRTDLLTV
ncbi:MAG: type II toxin-antitoxin system VapC family toxin [Ilumatobacteraceae bacterium]